MTAPDTSFVKKPKTSTKRVINARVGSNEPGVRFECKLDKRKRYAACSSTIKLAVKPGRHALRVRAIDEAGNIDPSPAKATWTTRRTRT